MKPEDMILVSVDDHVVEPPDMFEQHLPQKWKSKAPHVVKKKDGSDVWVFQGAQIPNIGLNAVAGRPPEEYGMEPTAFEQLRPGTYDVDARIGDMNANGVLAGMCFPSYPGFFGALFARQEDKELALTMLRAYNDWHIDEWCGRHPGRFIPLSLPPIWDPALMAEEVRRVASKGSHAITFTEDPTKHGFPSVHDPHWDPFWEACVDEGTVVCIHIGSGGGMNFTSMDAPVDVMITVQPVNIFSCAADLLWSRVLRKYDGLKIALSEGGIGWIPYFLERADWVYKRHHYWTRQDFGEKLPSEVFREHFLTCFIDDAVGVANREKIGVANIAWECDYPHSDSTWPTAPEYLWKSFEGVPDADIHAITHENALREFRADPFAHRPKEKCTVGALRAEATGVDLSTRSQGGKPPSQEPGVVTTQDVTRQLASVFAEAVE